jgi:hypothetical protein
MLQVLIKAPFAVVEPAGGVGLGGRLVRGEPDVGVDPEHGPLGIAGYFGGKLRELTRHSRRTDIVRMAQLLKGRFTVADYHRMVECGILSEDDRVELLDGQVVPMTPIRSPHAGCVNRLTRLLLGALGDRATIAVQNPAVLNDWSEPQPDLTG